MHAVTIEIPFCAGHRLLGHKGKCRFLHGHNYVAKVTVKRADGLLDGDGMVVDFGPLKEQVKGWIDEHWDHNMLLNENDPLWGAGNNNIDSTEIFGGRIPYSFKCHPTAENMAKELYDSLICLPPVVLMAVVILETPTCSAYYGRG